jgi:hypothetical protein
MEIHAPGHFKMNLNLIFTFLRQTNPSRRATQCRRCPIEDILRLIDLKSTAVKSANTTTKQLELEHKENYGHMLFVNSLEMASFFIQQVCFIVLVKWP